MIRVRSIRSRLLASGMVATLVLVGGVGGFLLWNQGQQARAAVQTEAQNRVTLAVQLLTRVTEPELAFAAQDLAGQSALLTALSGGAPPADARSLLSGAAIQLPGAAVSVFDGEGTLLATTIRAGQPVPDKSLPSLQATAFGVGAPAGPQAAGIESIGGNLEEDVAVAVRRGGVAVGAVLYSAALPAQVARYGAALGNFSVLLVAAGQPAQRISTVDGSVQSADVPPGEITDVLGRSTGGAPIITTSAGDVLRAWLPLTGANGGTAAAIAVEVPMSAATASPGGETGVVLIALSAALLISLALMFFADRFIRRPIARLERDVARIADGDYHTPIDASGGDEVGRLAAGVEGMRQTIAGTMRHRDASALQLREVSNALTRTGVGVDELRHAVVQAARTIVGEGGRATMLLRDGDALVDPSGGAGRALLPAGVERQLLSGDGAGGRRGEDRWFMAVPMTVQDRPVGALLVDSPQDLSASTRLALTTLANNGAVAMATTSAMEKEREALRVFRELHSMKSNFLSIAQHELRTPVTSILARIELLGVAWHHLDDEQRRDAIHEVEVSSRQLAAIVENIVNFSLLNGDEDRVEPVLAPVAATITGALESVQRLHPDELRVRVHIDCDTRLTARSLPGHLDATLRALLDNAVKFSRPGSVVQVGATQTGAMLRIEIVDDGPGMAPDTLPRIFDRFYQADGSQTRAHNGMGLGLAVVRRLCDENGATVRVQSTPGSGSRFTVVWPAGPPAAQPAAQVSAAAPAATKTSG